MSRIRAIDSLVCMSAPHPLVLACATGLLALGLAGSALAFSGGHGGIDFAQAGYGGNSGNGGGGGQPGDAGVAGVSGSGGNGGNGADGSGGAGGSVGTLMMVNSTVTTAITGSNGINGSYGTKGGGGGGGGGDGIYASNGITVTNQSVVTGGDGGYGGLSGRYAGGGGGGGSGLAGNGFTITNSGSITGGAGGYQGTGPGGFGFGGNGGGGHGVVGANLTITNAGAISGGTCAGVGGCETLVGNTAGDAILFTTGTNTLNLLTGSSISGNIELGPSAYTYVQAQDSGLALSSDIVLDDATTEVGFNTTHASLTISGVISGGGGLSVSGPASGAYRLILTGANTFTGGATVLYSNLQVDGSVDDATVIGGVLAGTGSLDQVTVSSSGTIAPGESSQMYGALTVNGRANLGGGSMLTIHTSNGSTCSSIHTNTLALGGTLQIRFEDTPKVGATCTLATATSVTGTFTQVDAGPATIAVSYTPPNITFTVIGSDDIFASGFE